MTRCWTVEPAASSPCMWFLLTLNYTFCYDAPLTLNHLFLAAHLSSPSAHLYLHPCHHTHSSCHSPPPHPLTLILYTLPPSPSPSSPLPLTTIMSLPLSFLSAISSTSLPHSTLFSTSPLCKAFHTPQSFLLYPSTHSTKHSHSQTPNSSALVTHSLHSNTATHLLPSHSHPFPTILHSLLPSLSSPPPLPDPPSRFTS